MGTILKSALGFFTGGASTWVIYLLLAAASAGAGAYATHRFDLATIDSLKLAQQQAIITAQDEAIKKQRAIDAQNWSAAAAEAQAQQTITTRTVTIEKEVPKYVHDFVPVPGETQTITVGCITYGFVRVLDAAALGVDPASLDLAPGQSDDTCTALKDTDLASAIVENYGIANGNAEQLDALIASVKNNAATAEAK